MEPIGGRVQFMYVGCGAYNGVHQARDSINSNLATHSKKSLGAYRYRGHFWISLLLLVLRGAGNGNARGSRIVPPPASPFSRSHLVHIFQDLLGDSVLFQQLTEVQDYGFIWYPILHYVDTGKMVEGGVLISIISRGKGERPPLSVVW